jgi:hypothetical protein
MPNSNVAATPHAVRRPGGFRSSRPSGGRRNGVFLLMVAAAFGTAACASTEGGTSSGTRSDSRMITEEELSSISVSTAYDVVERLRPLWLRDTGVRSTRVATEVVVVTDGQYFGDISTLRQIPAGSLRELRHMSGSEATNAYPWLASGRHVASAIVITMGRTGP